MGRGLRTVVGVFGRLIAPAARTIFNWLFVKPYSATWRYQRALRQMLPTLSPLGLLRHHQLALYFVLMMTIAVVTNSYRLSSVEAEDIGQNNLLLPLISDEFDFTGDTTGEPSTPPEGDLRPPTDVPYTLTEEGAVILKPHLTTTRPGVAGRSRIEEYSVQPGDTLSSIAQRFQINLNTLLWENRLTQRSVLRIGQKISILPTDGVSYRVGRGDTVAKIAQRFKVKVEDIASFNQIGAQLTVGSTIVIPGGRPPAQPAPSRPPSTATSSAPSTAVRSNTRLQWPTVRRRITQYFTWRHGGIDVGDAKGTPIYAAEGGVVETAGWNRGGYGYYIIIDHGGGLKTLYAHSSKLRVTVGDRVERGQLIADIGSTGRSTGPHLHLEVRVGGRRQNPLNYTR